jgi:ribonuclease T
VSDTDYRSPISERFRGFLPVVIDVETGGFNNKTDALLEVSAATLVMDEDGILSVDKIYEYHLNPFPGANVEQSALDFTGIDIDDPERGAIAEPEALEELFRIIRKAVKREGCSRAVMVAHNAHFDLGFINAAAERCNIKRNPFHPFSCFDTATLSGLAFGHTVLAQACQLAKLGFSNKEAHSAAYDTQKTAELFCLIVNRWQELGGWPLID